MPTKKPRVTFALSKEELEQIEMFQKKNSIKNQSQAILTLIHLGLDDFQQIEISQKSRIASSEFSDEAARMAKAFEYADDKSKEIVRLTLKEYVSSIEKKTDEKVV